MRPLWFDVSYWQKVINPTAMRDAGAYGCAVRAVVGQLYVDPYFAANWNVLDNSGLYRTGYGVYVPAQNWKVQLDAWYRVMPERDVVPRVIDLEIQDAKVPYKKIADDMWSWVGSIKARDGVEPIIYSRKNLVDLWLVPYWTSEQLNSVWWWMAQYTKGRIVEHQGPPDMPKGVRRERVVLQQTADHKPPPPGVTNSSTIDWDRWEIGDEREMRKFIGVNWGYENVPVPEPVDEGGLVYQVAVDKLNIRKLPKSTSTDLGDLHEGDVIVAREIGGTDAWIMTVKGWVCVQQKTTRYLELVQPSPAIPNAEVMDEI